MCSIGEDDFGDEGGAHTMTVDPKITGTELPDEVCKKCNENKIVVKLNLKDAQCRACFFTYVRHKFRAALGSTRIVDRGARVLLVFDTSLESCIMFDIIRYATQEDKFKRLTLTPYAVFIDDCWLNGATDDDNSYLHNNLQLLKYFGFETHYVDISNAQQMHQLTDFDGASTVTTASADARQKFRATLNSIKSLTSRQDFVQNLRENIVRDVAKQLNCKCAFMPVISAEIAATLLANVSLGRGSSVADDIAFCDSRQPNEVKLLRPIRTLLNIEVEAYARLNTDVVWPKKSSSYLGRSGELANSSIQNLTKQFVDGLQESFASTVSTVCRTGDKITAAATTKKTIEQQCKFCHSALDYEDSPTLFAIEYSRCVSANAGQSDINDAELMGRLADQAVHGLTEAEDVSLYQRLCHGCRNIFRDLNDDGQLAVDCI